MLQRCGFADADAKLPDADYVEVKLHFDGTASFRSGSRDGPDAIRLAFFNFESYDYYYDVDLAELSSDASGTVTPELAEGYYINELTPAYDRGETALLTARLAREFIATKAK